MKMNVDAVIQVILETSKSPGDNVIKMKNRVQKWNAHWESCNEIRDEIIALLPDSQIAEEAQKWIEYQQAIDNTLDISQEYLFKLASKNMDDKTPKFQWSINNHTWNCQSKSCLSSTEVSLDFRIFGTNLRLLFIKI